MTGYHLSVREAKIDPKEEAERLEKERQVARNALLLQVQGILTRVSDGGENEVDVDFTSIVEDACNEVCRRPHIDPQFVVRYESWKRECRVMLRRTRPSRC